MGNIDNKFEIWTKKLYDISKKNYMINFRGQKNRCLTITKPDIFELYDSLVFKDNSMSFKRAITADTNFNIFAINTLINCLGNSTIFEEGDISVAPKVNKTPYFILRNIKKTANFFKQEQGIDVMYMTFLYVRWHPIGSTDEYLTPLVNVPVSLEQDNIYSLFILKKQGEPEINPIFLYMLEQQQMTIPSINDKPLKEYLVELEKIFADLDFEIIQQANLCVLFFQKMVMFKDLVNNKERIINHPIIKMFCNDNEENTIFDLDNFPQIKESQKIVVIDADSSQSKALDLATQGQSFVLQGPPGTGKSQTITNIIASQIYQGKKILFVSQKTAALEVVFNMLKKIGLSDLALTLHNNNKLNKNEIINEIYAPFSFKKFNVKEEKINYLMKIDQILNDLEQYNELLNTKVYSLNDTLYELINKYFDLIEISKSNFKINFDLTSLDYKTLLENVNSINLFENEWKSITINNDDCYDYFAIDDISLQTKEKLDNDLLLIYNKIEPLVNTYLNLKKYISNLSLTFDNSLNILDDLNKLNNIDFNDIKINNIELLNEYIDDINFYLKSDEDLKKTYQEINNIFYDNIFNIDMKELANIIENNLNIIKTNIKDFANCSHYEIMQQLNNYANSLNNFINNKETFDKTTNYLTTLLHVSLDTLLSYDLYHINEELKNNTYSLSYFSVAYSNYDVVINNLNRYKELKENQKHLKKLITNLSYEAILTLNENQVDNYLIILDEKTNWFNFSKKEAKKDVINKISTYLYDNQTNIETVINILHLVKNYQEITNHLKQLGQAIKPLLNDTINLDNSEIDCQSYINELDKLHHIIILLPNVKENILKSILSFDNALNFKNNLYNLLECLPMVINNYDNDLQTLIENEKIVNETLKFVNTLKLYCKDFTLLKDIENKYIYLKNYAKIKQENQEKKTILDNIFTYDILKSKKQLFYINQINCFAKTYNLNQNELLLNLINHSKDIFFLILQFKERYSQSLPSYNHFKEMFTKEKNLENYDLKELLDLIYRCQLNINTLKDKKRFNKNLINYRSNPYLTNFIDYCLENNLKEDLANIYLKKIYHNLIENFIYDNDILENLNKTKLDNDIKELEKLSYYQMEISRQQVKSAWIDNVPSIKTIMASNDERNFLQNEKRKVRKKSLRVILDHIPHILMALKPCLMMSPLTVSNYLENDNYDFDLVIFDEASQIKPEEAIGSIYRGKQVIIAGDSKQLPPTSFFEKQIENDEDYDDEDIDETIDESILDLASRKLPSITLLWHYRSKIESLIAFSNNNFYDNELITIPSAKQNQIDYGIEYIKVDGIYEKNSRYANVIEAKKVVELIYQHILNHNDKSLGIIAFGERQRNTIEKVLFDYRKNLKNQDEKLFKESEEFFNNNDKEPFFIKNIENVQGDERDVIIFSIGYGPDEENNFKYNFGPLSKQGGQRRLNVAISRAKYNLKIVCSFLPTDLELSRIESEGGRLFKEYLEYAQMVSLGIHKFNDDILSVDGVKASIASFLHENGYKYLLNYGYSSFKIDIAIFNPNDDKQLICGIIIDNQDANITIKDKEVILKKVLYYNEWKIYNVNCKLYFENPSFINENILEFLNNNIVEEKIDLITTDENDLITIKEDESDDTSYNFILYQEFDFNEYLAINGLTDVKLWVIDEKIMTAFLNKEGPTLFKILVDKFAKAFNATAKEITGSIQKVITKEPFIWNRQNNFVYNSHENPCIVRQCIDNKSRSFESIYPLEISNCLTTIIRQNIGLSADGIIEEAMRIYNQKNKSASLIINYKTHLERLKEDKKIQEINGVYTIYQGGKNHE